MAKTKKPTGMTIARSGNVFTVEWKIGDSNYADGQQFQYRINNEKWHALGSSSNIGKKVTRQKYTFPAANYYPSNGKTKKVSKISFRVRGNKKGSSGWSGWTVKEYVFALPKKPTLTAEWDSNLENVTNFTWFATSDDSKAMFSRVEWQSVLTEDSKTSAYGASEYSSATSGTITKTESNAVINNGKSHKRWVRIRSLNPRGASDWVVKSHVYADPQVPYNFMASGYEKNGVIDVLCKFNTSKPKTNPIDSIKVEYLIATPVGTELLVPDGASWQTGATVAYATGKDAIRFSINNASVDEDTVLFVRPCTVHDNNETPGQPYIVMFGGLENPDTPVMTPGTNNIIRVESKNNSTVTGSFLAVIYHDLNDPENSYIAGIIEGSDTYVNISCPSYTSESDIKFGVQAIAGATYEEDIRADGSTCYNIIKNPLIQYEYPFVDQWMKSEEIWTSTTVRPSTIYVEQRNTAGTVRVSWIWDSQNVDGAQLAWSDNIDAWQSTDEPETYDVPILNSPSWNITGLDIGKEWYFRIRFYIQNNNDVQYSPWSETVSIRLTSAPAIPTLNLTDDIVLEGEEIEASWVYTSNDGTEQSYAEIREVTLSQGLPLYGDLIGSTESDTKIIINPSELGWEAGSTHYLAVMVRSASGRDSDWSEYIPLTVVTPIECEILSTSLVNETIDGRELTSLKDMPFNVTITGAGDGNLTSLVIERTDAYILDRPDEGKTLEGYEGEAVYVYNQTGDEPIVIEIDDLIGRLDDGAQYRLVATVSDSYGQKATASIEFEVHWTHQALMPLANATVDAENLISIITPIAPAGAIDSDRCDIYRLSADKPILIYPNAEFGKSYVDPYAAFNEHGGHRVVFKTINNDYITADNQLAWIDLRENENDYIEFKKGVIDFDEGRIEFNYNLDVSHSWSKDFTETRYLGGSVQGDWNPAIGRTGTLSSVAIRIIDKDMMEAVRRLASYAGICKVRTPDGTCISADVQVSESWSHDRGQQIAEFNLSFTRVDPEEYEGMTLEEYLSGLSAQRMYSLNQSLNVIETVEDGGAGGRTFAVNNEGNLIMTVQDNAVEGIDFSLNNGRLVVEYGD